MDGLHRPIRAGESKRVALSSDNPVGGPFRCGGSGTGAEVSKRSESPASLRGTVGTAPINAGRGWRTSNPGQIFCGFPYRAWESTKVLGVTFYTCLNFAEQLSEIFGRG